MKVINKKAKVITNTSGHGFAIGSEVRILSINQATKTIQAINNAGQYSMNKGDYTLIPMTNKEIDKKIKELSEEIEILKRKKDFLDMSGEEDLNEIQFKTYQILTTLKGTKNDMEKAKLISKIIE